MKLVLLSKEEIHSSKNNTDYVKCMAISDKGVAIEIFSEASKLNIPADTVLSPKEVAELFTTYKSVDVEFDNRGRVLSLS